VDQNQQTTTHEQAGEPEVSPVQQTVEQTASPAIAGQSEPLETRAVVWVFWGPNRLRAGWSILGFLVILITVSVLGSVLLSRLRVIGQGQQHVMTPAMAVWGELVPLLGLIAGAAVMALVERRRGNLLAYNLLGPAPATHFISGLAAGFAALSIMVGALYVGHWITFGPVALSGAAIAKYAAVWAIAFLLVGCFEEGMFRCYLQATFTRGLNFWWALGIIACICGILLWRGKGNGVWGVYLMALLGLLPCFWLHWSKAPRSGFWQAAWVTSTLFGFVHTGNNGENWIGIFAAALIGFVFCVSIYVTGSAWWAIGCHAAWDWAETYFYGTADSGMTARGHLMTASPAGNPLWSGGTDGPEGSVLVLPVVLLLLLAVLLLYRRRPALEPAS
jgi:hypothetical protein